MKIKRILIGLLSATILLSTTAFADQPQTNRATEDDYVVGSFTGVVEEITQDTPVEGAQFISLKDTDQMPINMIVSQDTYIIGNKEVEVGDTVSGYYNANLPIIAIYPPQYGVDFLVIEREDLSVKIDIFDEDLLSSDKMLKLNISDETMIVTRDGKSYTGSLANQKLAVMYDIVTASIPGQTNPSKVIVLSQTSADDQNQGPFANIENMDLLVENTIIKAPTAYTIKESDQLSDVMVPLRAISDGLSFRVLWQGKAEEIMVGKEADQNVSLKIGSKSYTAFSSKLIQLETAPELKDGVTYVPLDFFKKVLGMNNAYVFEGQIVIDNQEEMH